MTNRTPLRIHGISLCLVLGILVATAVVASPVRNRTPQATVSPPTVTQPIYYPLNVIRADDPQAPLPEELLEQFLDYHTSMRYEQSAELAMRLVTRAPDRPLVHYNLACALSRLQRTDEALAALERAVDCGWRNVQHTLADNDLIHLRELREFTLLIRRMQRLIEAEQLPAAPLRTDALEDVVTDLQRHAPRWLERYHVPGATIAVIRNHALAWQGAVGVQSTQARTPMPADAAFQLHAPMHLMMLAMTSDLHQQGALPLETMIADAQTLRPEVPRVVRASRARPINTSGASRIYVLPDRDASRRGSSSRRSDALDHVAPNRLFSVLQLAVELGGTGSFRQQCDQRVIQPLGLQMAKGETQPAASVVSGYSRLGSMSAPLSGPFAAEHLVNLSASDMATMLINLAPTPNARFSRQHAQPEHPGGWQQAAPTQTTNAADDITPDVPRIDSDSMKLVRQLAHELGMHQSLDVRLSYTTYGRCLELIGDQNGCGCYARYYCDLGTGAIVLFNSETGQPAAERIVQLAIGGGS